LGCGSGGGGHSADLAAPPDLISFAAHPALPGFNFSDQNNITAPELTPVFWSTDTESQQVIDFLTFMGTSSYWTTWAAEYKVGPASVKPPITITDAPPMTISDSELQTLVQKFATNFVPTANSLLVIIIPQKTTLTNGGASSCSFFGGYHSVATINQMQVPYATAARCPNPQTGQEDVNELTVSISHEIAEAATDPQGSMNFFHDHNTIKDPNVLIPSGGGEVGDLCINLNAKLTNSANNQSYVVQRLWSNKAALSGDTSPCVPSKGPYFGVAVVGSDTTNPSQITVKAGSSTTFELQGFDFGTTASPMKIQLIGQFLSSSVHLTPDVTTTLSDVSVGTPLKITLSVDAGYTGPAQQGQDSVLLVFSLSADKRLEAWWGTLNIK
jgi:hypothetical protein